MEKSQKPLENSQMSELTWASDQLQNYIAPPGSAAGKGERIRNAARKLRWSYWRTHSVWYADERVSVKPRELREIEVLTGVKYGQEQLREYDELIAAAESLLAGGKEDLRSAAVTLLRALAGSSHRPRA
ncbi:hypothetical protein [Aminobacter sp. MDW-2]|uniref:hypothetical protein n=1 Tax=Aminobacter sp. MDW-2 TaxID=2666139 RepID=UPI0012B01538|nr:hypothetical protein [Aminobacter sp. MDW-2]QNH32368.1 hypothetical protein H5P29_17605 [Aminobacter sp. MDW-2]WMC99315.1 hypothetical protein RAR13_11720 [Aminobacter aminovorans]